MPLRTRTVFDSFVSAVRPSVAAVPRFPKMAIPASVFAVFLIIGALAMMQATPASGPNMRPLSSRNIAGACCLHAMPTRRVIRRR